MSSPFLPLLLPFSCAAAAQTSDARPSGELAGSMMQMLFGLAVVIAVLLATLWLIRRLSAPRGTAAAAIKVLAATALGPRERLVLVRIGEEVLVLGVAPGRVSTLHQISAADFARIEAEQDAPAGSKANFAGWLKRRWSGAVRASSRHRCWVHGVSALLLALLPLWAQAQALPAVTTAAATDGSTTYSLTVQTLALLTLLSFIPAMVLMMTSFTRIIIVLSLLRQALGTQTAPPNQVLLGLALFVSFFIMAPVAERVYDDAYLPLSAGQIEFDQALERAAVPMKDFMLAQVREPDLELFAGLAKLPPVDKAEDLPLRVVIPAFVTSELKTAFQIGFIVFIPFIIIDMVVASVLMSMGMMMMSPVIVSLPFKIMLFVLVDGWTLLIGSLVQSFAI